MKYLMFLALFLSGSAHAWTATSLDHLSLDVARYSCLREPMTPDIACNQYKGMVRLNWNVGLLNDLVKWNNEIIGQGTYGKFTTYEWHYMVIIPTPWNVSPFLEHRSRHTLDQGQPTIAGRDKPERFPVADSYGVKVCFFGCGK